MLIKIRIYMMAVLIVMILSGVIIADNNYNIHSFNIKRLEVVSEKMLDNFLKVRCYNVIEGDLIEIKYKAIKSEKDDSFDDDENGFDDDDDVTDDENGFDDDDDVTGDENGFDDDDDVTGDENDFDDDEDVTDDENGFDDDEDVTDDENDFDDDVTDDENDFDDDDFGYDGETIVVKKKIRLIGINAPNKGHPDNGGQFYGDVAYNYLKSKIEKQNVFIAFDSSDYIVEDGVWKAYVYDDNGVNMNCAMLYKGYALVNKDDKPSYIKALMSVQTEALLEKRGMWDEFVKILMSKDDKKDSTKNLIIGLKKFDKDKNKIKSKQFYNKRRSTYTTEGYYETEDYYLFLSPDRKPHRCLGIKKDGSQCDRMTTNLNGYCNKHQKQAYERHYYHKWW